MNFQKLFNGYQSTPPLWKGQLEGLEQFYLEPSDKSFIVPDPVPRLRLGRWVEIFVKQQLAQKQQIQILAENLQILKQKQTIGELDFLIIKNLQPVHLEVVYKFYLYDNINTYQNPIDYWIGPNRSDSLRLKLDKLISKQLPLLHHPTTLSYLDSLGFKADKFQQKVCFKAQLFLPLKNNPINISPLNKECISGYYTNIDQVHFLKDFMFFVPTKLMWLSHPQLKVDWETLNETLPKLKDQCQKHRSVLVWLKDPEENLQKAFITWW